VIVLAGHLATVSIEHDERRGAPPALTARLAKRVGREIGGVDGCGGHRRSSNTLASPSAGRTARLPYVVQRTSNEVTCGRA
jgi:hypothetical protein